MKKPAVKRVGVLVILWLNAWMNENYMNIPVKLQANDVKSLDAFRKEQPDLPSRSEAIRRLLNDQLVHLGIKEWTEFDE